MRVKIEWNGEELDIYYDIFGNYHQKVFRIDKIIWLEKIGNEVGRRGDVYHLLCNNDKIMEELENLCLKKIAEDYDNAEPTEDCLKAGRGDR